MKGSDTAAIAAAAAIIILGWKTSEGISQAITDVGSGLKNTLSGAGSALEYSGMGIYGLGSGAGQGIEYLGEGIGTGVAGLGVGVGSGISQVGSGIYEIGKGTGYAISGANPQDILQTLVDALRSSTAGNEASTYQAGGETQQIIQIPTAQNQPNATSQGNQTAQSFATSQSSIKKESSSILDTIKSGASFVAGATGLSSVGNVISSVTSSVKKSSSSSTSSSPQQTQSTATTAVYQGLPISISPTTSSDSSSGGFVSRVGKYLKKFIFI